MNKIFAQNLFTSQPLACTMFESAVRQGKLAHAYLLCGRAPADKRALSLQLAAFLNCQAKDKDEMGSCLKKHKAGAGHGLYCQNCRWIEEGKHPGAYLILEPEENKSGKIGVDSARKLSQELAKTSPYFRVVVVEDAAEAVLHRASANALLKTIEEPGPACIFLLFTVNRQDVLATIFSRCQEVPLLAVKPKPAEGEGKEALEAAIKEIADKSSFLLPGKGKTQALLTRALSLSAALRDLADNDLDAEMLVDLTCLFLSDNLKDKALLDEHTSLYLLEICQEGEKAKEQINHYVSAKVAFEALCLRLKDSYLRYCDKKKLEPKVGG